MRFTSHGSNDLITLSGFLSKYRQNQITQVIITVKGVATDRVNVINFSDSISYKVHKLMGSNHLVY